jgi:uncharacterized protein
MVPRMEAISFGLKLLLELIPLFVLISTVVYMAVDRLTPARLGAILGRPSRWAGVAVAAGAGALTPFCSCSTVPVINGMKVARIPVASIIAFLVASPLISPVAVALLATAIGLGYAVLYAVSGLVFAAAAGVLVERWYGSPVLAMDGSGPPSGSTTAGGAGGSAAPGAGGRATAAVGGSAAPGAGGCGVAACAVPGGQPFMARSGSATLLASRQVPPSMTQAVAATPLAACCGPEPSRCVSVAAGTATRLFDSLPSAFRRALADLRRLWIPLVLAAAVGAAIHGYVPADFLSAVAGSGQFWAIPAAAFIGLPIYASVVVLLPLGSALLAAGVSTGAVTAFLMGASGFSVPEGIMLSRILPAALLVRVLIAFATGVVLIGYLFEWLVG